MCQGGTGGDQAGDSLAVGEVLFQVRGVCRSRGEAVQRDAATYTGTATHHAARRQVKHLYLVCL